MATEATLLGKQSPSYTSMAARGAAGLQNTEMIGLSLPAGPGNEYSRQMVYCMHFLLLLQVCGVTCRLTLLGDPVGGLWMLVTTNIGVYAWLHEMDVAFVSVWGILCFFNCIFDIVLFGASLVIAKRPVEGVYFAANLCITMVHISSGIFALHLYHVSATHRHENQGHHLMPGFDPLGHLFGSRDPEAANSNTTSKPRPELPSSVSISKLPTPMRCQAPLPRPRQQQPSVGIHPAIKEEPVEFPRWQHFESSELMSTSVCVMPELMESLNTDALETRFAHHGSRIPEAKATSIAYQSSHNHESTRMADQDCLSPAAVARHDIGGLKTPQAAGASAVAEAAAAKELEQLYEGCDWRGIQAPPSPTLNAKTTLLLKTPLPVWASGCCESSPDKETRIANQDSQKPEAMESPGFAATAVPATAVPAGAASILGPGGQQQPT